MPQTSQQHASAPPLDAALHPLAAAAIHAPHDPVGRSCASLTNAADDDAHLDEPGQQRPSGEGSENIQKAYPAGPGSSVPLTESALVAALGPDAPDQSGDHQQGDSQLSIYGEELDFEEEEQGGGGEEEQEQEEEGWEDEDEHEDENVIDDDTLEDLIDLAGFEPDELEALVSYLQQDGKAQKARIELDAEDVPPILKTALARILRRREKLPQYNTVDDAIYLLGNAKKILVLSGAGISVSCGIPDFRSKDGIYARLQAEGKYDLSDPQEMFDKHVFLEDPSIFYSFCHQIYPSNFVPSASHRFIKALEERGKLLRNYTQNIDTLEQEAGIQRVLQCHGSFATATCTNPKCGHRAPGESIKADVFAQRVPQCPVCNAAADVATDSAEGWKNGRKKNKNKAPERWIAGGKAFRNEESDDEEANAKGVMKPDIVFFGEKLPDDFSRWFMEDREEVDLVLVIGSSLRVAPVSELLRHVPAHVPQILINKTPVTHFAMDILLLGEADRIVSYLSSKLGWTLPPPPPSAGVGEGPSQQGRASSDVGTEPEEDDRGTAEATGARMEDEPERVAQSHVWLFAGAEGGTFVETLQAEGGLNRGKALEAVVEEYEEDEDEEMPMDGERTVARERSAKRAVREVDGADGIGAVAVVDGMSEGREGAGKKPRAE